MKNQLKIRKWLQISHVVSDCCKGVSFSLYILYCKWRIIKYRILHGNHMRQSVEYSTEGEDTNWKKNTACFSCHFFFLCIFPSFLLSHSISSHSRALIIAELHQDNQSVESRAAAAVAGWENTSCLLQPAHCARICVIFLSVLQRIDNWWLCTQPSKPRQL